MSVRISQILALFAFIPIVHAQPAKSPNDCEAALTTQASRLDYEVSDLEGTYLALLEKIHGLPELDSSRRAPFIEDTLNLKADILNTIGDLLPYVPAMQTKTKKGARPPPPFTRCSTQLEFRQKSLVSRSIKSRASDSRICRAKTGVHVSQ